MKIVKKSTENCHFYSHEKLLNIAWACFRNVNRGSTGDFLFCFRFSVVLFDDQ